MKNSMKKSIVLFAVCLSLGACSSEDKELADTGGKSKDSDNDKKSSLVLNLMESSEIGSMDTIFTQDEPSLNMQSNVFAGLYELNEADEIIPAIAKELPEISEDGKTYTIQLKEDTQWSNGDLVTAHDFIFSY